MQIGQKNGSESVPPQPAAKNTALAGASSLKREKALTVVHRLRAHGFAAYFAGGCVRDEILGLAPKDYDVATDARPEVVTKLFDHTVAVGAKFGVVLVVLDGDHIEVATFRSDAAYLDGRHPSAVRYGTLEEDAQRRDFTIGGMFLDPITGRIIDLVGGVEDLRAGVVRAIGNPEDRFREDRLRMMRAIRFASRLGFDIEPRTLAAIRQEAANITAVSNERLGEETVRILTEGGAARGMTLMVDTGLASALLPEVEALRNCRQPKNFHPEGDVYRHTMLALSMLSAGVSETLAFGVLLHDIAKPLTRRETDGQVTFYGHTERGAELATAILGRLRRPRHVQERVAYLVRNHLRLCMAPRMRTATLRRMLAEEGFEELIELSLIDALASSSYLGFYHFCRRAQATLNQESRPVRRLLTGHDLLALGVPQGPQVGRLLREVEDMQLEGALTEREAALNYIRERLAPLEPKEPAQKTAAPGKETK